MNSVNYKIRVQFINSEVVALPGARTRFSQDRGLIFLNLVIPLRDALFEEGWQRGQMQRFAKPPR